jgi:hypothetical protein
MLTAEQTIAIGRKYGAHRYRFVVEHDQHDFVKVNSRLETVKIFFACSVNWRFLVQEPEALRPIASVRVLRIAAAPGAWEKNQAFTCRCAEAPSPSRRRGEEAESAAHGWGSRKRRRAWTCGKRSRLGCKDHQSRTG